MEILIDIALNILLIFGAYMVRWCRVHKETSLAIFIIIAMIIDVIFILWRFGVLPN